MNILHINTRDTGGAATAAIRLHKGLLRMGIRSKLLINDQRSISTIPECYIIEKNATIFKQQKLVDQKQQIKKMPQGYEAFNLVDSLYSIEKHSLYEWADIIHLHWVADFLDWSTFFSNNKKPIVWTLHDMLPFTGGYHYEKGFPFDAYKELIKNQKAIKIDVLKNQPIQVVALSNWLFKKSKSSDLFKQFPHHLIPNGLDPNIFKRYEQKMARQALGLPLDKNVIIFVADYINNKRKGFDFLLSALPFLEETIGLAVIGESVNDDLKKPNFYPLGKISEPAFMALAYSAADLFVHPAIEDNLPNTVLESILCGTPVIAFNIGGIPDMIIPKVNGLICNKMDSETLGKTIKIGLNISFDKEEIVQKAKIKFNQSLQTYQYNQLYKDILKRNNVKTNKEKSTSISLDNPTNKKPHLPNLTKIPIEVELILQKEAIGKKKLLVRKKEKEIELQKQQIIKQEEKLKSKSAQLKNKTVQLKEKSEKVAQKVAIIIEQNKTIKNQTKALEIYEDYYRNHETLSFLIKKVIKKMLEKLRFTTKK